MPFNAVPMLIILFLLFPFFHVQQTLNVHDFGAAGDGSTDDTQAINKAFKAAARQHADLYFPTGTYLCNTVDNSGNILFFEADSLQGTNIYGDGNASVITTGVNNGSVLFYIRSYYNTSGLTIKNLSFQNTHGVIAKTTQGLFLTGMGTQNLNNVTVSGCQFQGFSTALSGQGINGWTITGNTFGAPLGHDNAKNDNDPAIFLWLFDNQNGRCFNVSITNNTADGYTAGQSLGKTVTHRPMDGFVFGTAYGITITGNTTRHFSEEHYNLLPKMTHPEDTSLTVIDNNYIDCSLPAGTSNSDGSPHKANYGIRCDISNARITNNMFVNYTYGILIRGNENPDAHFHSYVITGNQLHAATDLANYDVTAGILIQGNTNPVTDIRMTNNDIYTSLPDLPNFSRSIRVENTKNLKRSLITNNTVHLIQ